MPSFTAQVSNLKEVGPICQIEVAISTITKNQLKNQNQAIPASLKVFALIDTGASGTVINPTIVKELNLVARGITNIATPSTSRHQCNVYDVDIIFPNRVLAPNIPVIEAPLEKQNISCLIGRDILSRGVLIYIGYAKTFYLSF